ncbi:MAG: YeeE/YedE family protein [Thiohalomonadaceae bacterium]
MGESPFLLIASTSAVAGLVAGFVMHRSDFCVTAMFRDLFLVRDFFLLRMLVLLVVVSMLAFELGRAGDLLAPYPFPLLGPGSLATLIGGVLFGVGMVLAGGCVVGTLYKLGAGSVVSAVAFGGLLAGSALYAEWHPWWSAFARATAFGSAITLPQALDVAPALLIFPLAALGAVYLYRCQRHGLLTRPAYATGHIAPRQAALILSAVGFVSWLFIGMPLGITTSYAKLGATLEALVWPEHVVGLAYFQAQSLDYTPPFADAAVRGGAGPQLDAIAAIQYPLIVGIILGAAVSALRVREWRLRWRIPSRHYASALLGGMLLGAAARMVPGCNIWHLWGGVPILAVQSLLFLLGILPGAWIGSRLFIRFVIR